MPRLTPADWRTLVKVFEADGFSVDRTTGDHIIMTKPGVIRPIVIPKYKEVGLDIIRANLRMAHMDRERYFELLKQIR